VNPSDDGFANQSAVMSAAWLAAAFLFTSAIAKAMLLHANETDATAAGVLGEERSSRCSNAAIASLIA